MDRKRLECTCHAVFSHEPAAMEKHARVRHGQSLRRFYRRNFSQRRDEREEESTEDEGKKGFLDKTPAYRSEWTIFVLF